MSSSRPPMRLSVTIFIVVALFLLSFLSNLLSNVAVNTLPSSFTPYLRYAWIPLGVIIIITIILTVWQTRRDALAASSSSPFNSSSSSASSSHPTPSPVPSASSLSMSVPLPVSASSSTGMYHSCVLSYATDDEAFVQKLYADLQRRGVPCWYAPHDLEIGEKQRDALYEAIDRQDKLLMVLSEHAIESVWVEEEVSIALEREHEQPGTLLLFPLRLDDEVLHTRKAWARTVRQRFIGDFRHWQDEQAYQQALQRLLRDLKV